VLEVKSNAAAVEIRTAKESYSAAKAILTTGPWIARFLRAGHAPQFRIYRQTLCWFAIERYAERYDPKTFPVFIWITGTRVQDMMYGFPAIDGVAGGVKVATERYENTVDPDDVPREVDERSVAEMWTEYIAPRLPDLSRRCLRTATCLYTVTPDAKFVIDFADANQRILFASACSGHGFKHSPAIGEALAQRCLGFANFVDFSMFSLDRLRKTRT
jgi:sarcosine oxidase